MPRRRNDERQLDGSFKLGCFRVSQALATGKIYSAQGECLSWHLVAAGELLARLSSKAGVEIDSA